ncbi:hypothetical protein M9H77_17141 [Catharanthus roseus]|uniref:Uncharacterized protein n=1 Tax=Catharanthus roseus TaxID=4058 RepID=A0ACC0B3T1_CATRO|nr:hypothetical protein M9H77_17141 [Catharanthus roseus]
MTVRSLKPVLAAAAIKGVDEARARIFGHILNPTSQRSTTRSCVRSSLVRRFHSGTLMISSMMTLWSWLDKNKSNATSCFFS